MEAQYGKFLDMIRAIRINVPLVDVLAGMANYGKFLKELISNKHKIKQIYAVFLSDESSTMIQNIVPPKLGDPKSFLIPCNFNRTFSCNALADLGASINLMPYLLYAKLSLETLKPTKISVRLDDRSFQYPVGIAENMLVEVEEDFDALLDEGSKILHYIEGTLLEEEIFAKFDKFMVMIADENSYSESDTEEPTFERIIINTNYKIKTSLEEPPTNLELKPLPDNLEYVFLEEPYFLPIIISSQLSKEKKNKLIQLLDDKKLVVQKQRRLNPNMQEVVKKEIMKLLDNGIIYLIADSPWVSPIHCVLKKGGITVVTNKNDEPVPIRTVTGWRVCIDYRKLNEATTKDHFPLPFMDQILSIHGRFVFGNSFESCLNNLDKMLQHCGDAHLVLNWEKCHFMVKEGIVLGHKVSSARLEVDKEKVDVISKLPPPANIKEIKDRKGTENVAAYHLSRIKNDKSSDDNDNFPGETLMEINTKDEPCYHLLEETILSFRNAQSSNQRQRDLKRILGKPVKDNPDIWSRKLDDALWAFRTTYKTSTGFPAQSVGSSNTDVLDSPCLLVLITGTSQSRQHGRMPTKIELTLEQSQQGVSNDVLVAVCSSL
nr:DNA-directed DNA polymerase [Tanacetum cinerariifolium]